MAQSDRQTAGSVLMIRPFAFHSNPQTASSNRFQGDPGSFDPTMEQRAAAAQFQGLVDTLRAARVHVVVEPDSPEPETPDSVFPNNWVSFHSDGTAVLFPMMAPNRRAEVRPDIVERLSHDHGFRVDRVIDLTPNAESGHFLEGTGSMVLDRVNRVAYACISERTTIEGLGEFGQRLDYEIVAFEARDREGWPIYHTNVMMSVGDGFAIICDDTIDDADQRAAVLRKLASTGHEIVSITRDQMWAFLGNCLQLEAEDGSRVIAMSRQAEDSLTAEQAALLRRYGRIVSSPIHDIERSAGGSVRCMLAEIHLPRR